MTTSTATLQVDDERSVLIEDGREPVTLPLSPRLLAARHWPRGRPSLLQLEQAIDDVESAIEQAGLRQASRHTLVASACLRQALPRRFSTASAFSRDEIESEFSRQVRESGAAAPPAEVAPDGLAAAALLLVREVMHHLGFQVLRTGSDD